MMMAKNNLTPEQDVLTREFYVQVALAPNTLPDNPALKRQLGAICLNMLNYNRLTDGRFISKGKKIKMAYGQQPSLEEYPDEWAEDYQAALQGMEKEEITLENKGENKADSSKSSKSSKIWKALFPKDV
jgi:hypothetical protein